MPTRAKILLLAVILVSGCSRAVRVDVEGASVGDAAVGKRFAIHADRVDPASLQATQTKLEQDIEQYLVAQGDKSLKPPYPLVTGVNKPEAMQATIDAVRRAMESRGFVYDETSPEVIVGIGVTFGHLDYEVSPIVHRGEQFGAARPIRPDSGKWSSWPTETHPPYQDGYTAQGGHAAGTEVTALTVQLANPAGQPVWHGAAVAVGSYAQLERMRPVLLEELFGEFPQPSGKPAQRLVPIGD